MCPRPEEFSIYEALEVGVEMRLRFLDCEECVAAMSLLDELFELKGLQREVQHIRRS
jgi:hypothetical protein